MPWKFYSGGGYEKTGEYIGSEFPVGTIVSHSGLTIPAGWLFCDGAAVSRTTYPSLFDTIGTTYGSGDGSTTFNVPESSGQIIYAKPLATRITSASLSGGGTTSTADAADSSFAFFVGG